MKTDARIRYTKMVLKNALFKCLKEKPIKDITIKEVCDLAEVNRATFYKHYKDCYDIVREIEQEQLDEFSYFLHTDLLNHIEKQKLQLHGIVPWLVQVNRRLIIM